MAFTAHLAVCPVCMNCDCDLCTTGENLLRRSRWLPMRLGNQAISLLLSFSAAQIFDGILPFA